MAVPKKRTGKSAQAKRRANWKATVPATTKCATCGTIVPTHTVCPECGSYKGKVVSIKNENYKPEETVVEKPKAKRTSKKKAEEAKVEVKETETEAKAEEETKKESEKETEE